MFCEAPQNTAIAVKSRELDLSQQDSADRFIVATILIYSLRLMTLDEALRSVTERGMKEERGTSGTSVTKLRTS